MAEAKSIETELSKLGALRSQAKTPEIVSILKKALSSKTNLIAARAAEIAEHVGATELMDDLETVFRRFMQNPAKTDKGCLAKHAAAKAIYQLGGDRVELYLTGIRHHQMEASWGKPVDTAVELRGVCALGLVRMRYRDSLLEMVPLLADPDPQGRVAAVRAIAYDERDGAAPLLRYKVLSGDSEIEVIRECFEALLRLSPGPSLKFVAEYLKSENLELRQAAAVAISASRTPVALQLLRDEWEGSVDGNFKLLLLSTMAALRTDAAMEFLLSCIRNENNTTARAAVEAMALYKRDEAIRERVAAAVTERDEMSVNEAFKSHFA